MGFQVQQQQVCRCVSVIYKNRVLGSRGDVNERDECTLIRDVNLASGVPVIS